uniref:Uncharacterized protein n=1 Tax=Anguilla anguilla TaxID=7936 RepID=A0A0E9UBA3_ANGAN
MSAAFDTVNQNYSSPPWLRRAFLGLPWFGLLPILQIGPTRSPGWGLPLLLIPLLQEYHRDL